MFDIEWYKLVAVVLVGLAAGFINTLAGSGSLLSLPMLMFLGLPANVANGTNRIAILLQNVVAVSSYRQQKMLDFKQGLALAAPAVVGSLIGARIAYSFNEAWMRAIIAGLLLFMFVMILLKPKQWIENRAGGEPMSRPLQMLIFFIVGIYGGFIQAGVGLFLLAALVLGCGIDLVKANALKVFIVLVFTPMALIVFVLYDQVHWGLGLTLAIGNMAGAFIGARLAVSWGPRFVRAVLLVVLVVAASKLLGLWELIGGLF